VGRIALLLLGHTVPELVPRRGDFAQWFAKGLGKREDELLILDLEAGDGLPDARDISSAVLSGSPAMLTERAPWSESAIAWTRDALVAELPLLGVCFGHQVLAEAGGGEVDFHPAGREIGSVPIEVLPAGSEDPLFQWLPRRFIAQASHSQSVLRLPTDAEHLARGQQDLYQGFRLGPRAWGVQFHPEFDADIIKGYIRARAKDIEAEGLDVQRLLQSAEDHPAPSRLLEMFARCYG
jgi:GMP synthase (glutamine-hydrolysing)